MEKKQQHYTAPRTRVYKMATEKSLLSSSGPGLTASFQVQRNEDYGTAISLN